MGAQAWMPLALSANRRVIHGARPPFTVDVKDEGEAGAGCVTLLLQHPVTLVRLLSATELNYRRSWQLIRANKVGIRQICFVLRGSIRLTRPQGSCMISVGEAVIIDTDCPFHMRLTGGEEGGPEILMVSIPAHLFLAHLEGLEKLLSAVPLENPEGQVVRRLLDMLADASEDLGQATLDLLVTGLLVAMASSVRCSNPEFRSGHRLRDKRLADIESYILMNLSDVELCCENVAEHCNISPRYLCHVLKGNNTSFSDMLWKSRLSKARDLLIAAATRHYPVHEIAYISGFKSSAHFSRKFKATYGCPPRVFRARHNAPPIEQQRRPALRTAWDAAWVSA
jgi:AraC family transcriptional regulator, positive regulator of tynA and feaB